jgi:pimeloyl-ACP methyl ester carboxylesterase
MMIQQGNGEPLVLLHGVTCSERVWSRVIPYLAEHNEVYAITLLGHRGGSIAKPGTRMEDVNDDVEAILDRLKLDKPHIAGNSLGGWAAIEMARRGRAKSVCALSPAGFWNMKPKTQLHAAKTLKRVVRMTQMTRWALPAASRLGMVRKFAMKENALYGHRLSSREFVSMADDLLGCTARHDLLNIREQMKPLHPIPCPIMLAWSEFDHIFPPHINGAIARDFIPQAEWRVIPKVGHVPMLDNPAGVADIILETVRRASNANE